MKKRFLLALLALTVSGAMGVNAHGAAGNDVKPQESGEVTSQGANEVTVLNVQAEQSETAYREESGTNEKEASYEEYEPFGLSFDSEKEALYYKGELVRFFYDGVDIDDIGQAVRCEFYNENGVIDVHTVREAVQNPDGSTDPFGILKGLEKDSREEFENKAFGALFERGSLECTATVLYGCDDGEGERGTSFEELFEGYREFGIEYIEKEEGRSGCGNVYFNGQAVNVFTDMKPDGGVFSYQSADGGEINVKTVYEGEKCVGTVEVIHSANS